MFGVIGEEHRRLPRRVTAADQDHFFAEAQASLNRRGPVPHASSLEIRQSFDLRAAVTRASRDHHRTCMQNDAIVHRERKGAVLARTVERLYFAWYDHFGTKLLRLQKRSRRQCLSGNASREA